MDYGTLRGFFALLILALFIIIVVWSYSKKRKDSFDDVANSIFEEDKLDTADKTRHPDKRKQTGDE
ncbi:MAG: CcoQ/FixQ family Cbb3-type cytochrome c oxidase assembly chaperone [Colwellia sp.]